MSNDREKRAARAEQMRQERDKAAKRERSIITLGIIAVVVVLIGLAAVGIRQVSKDNAEVSDVIAPANATDDFAVVYDTAAAGGTPVEGAKPVVVDLYEDFQCPACQAFEQISGAFLKELVASGEITLNYRPYSFLDRQSLNEYSSRSTNLAMCVLDSAGVEKFVEVHEYLFANQPAERTAGPENPALIAAAKDLGVTGIDSCVNSGKHIPWIKKAKDAGEKAGFRGTPAVFINGKESEARSPDDLRAAIDDAKS